MEVTIRMNFRIKRIILSLFFVLGGGVVFSFGMEASATHGDDTGKAAGDVDPTVEADVQEFLNHIIGYYKQVVSDNMSDPNALNRAVVIYGRDIRQEGPYKNEAKNMYSMGLNENGVLTNHARYPDRFGYEFKSDASNSAVASTIKALIDGSDVDMPYCEGYGDQGRFACATKVASPSGNVTVIAGLHHEENDTAFVAPMCDGFGLETSAEDVFNNPTDNNLEAYVKGIIAFVQKQIADVSVKVGTANPTLSLAALGGDMKAQSELAQKILQEIYSNVACFGNGDFKHENIYAFIMSANPESSTVLVNGNNFDLNGTNLELNDNQLPGDDKSIAGLFKRALEGETSAYANYHWDDPTTEADNRENWFRDNLVPGTSCKRSYIEVADINKDVPTPEGTPPANYIFGSGTYPGDDVCASGDGGGDDDMTDDDMMDDDMMDDTMDEAVSGGGCAITGTSNTSQSALLNMFLIASFLFSVVFLRRRA